MKILDIIDFERVNVLLEGFNKTTGFVTAILDLDGNVLSQSGWRQICTDFHRTNSKTSKRCKTSDTILAGKMAEGEKYHFYKCLNGLVDVAIPIIIKDEHIANLFTGQFFFEKPDFTFFQKQAKKYGFDEKVYLDALKKVPVVSESKIKTAMEFLLNVTELIAEMSLQKLEQIELNNAIKESEERFRLLYNYSPDMYVSVSPIDATILLCNDTLLKETGYSREEVIGYPIFKMYHNDCLDKVKEVFKQYTTIGEVKNRELILKRKDGSKIDVSLNVYAIRDKFGKILYSMSSWRDISEHNRAQKELIESKSFFEQLFIQSSTSTQLLDKDGWCVRINPKLSELFGVLPEHIEGKKYNILKDDEIIRTGVIKHLKKVFEKKETVRWEVNFDIQHASESTGVIVSKPERKWFQNIAYPILDAQKEIIYVIIQHEDITESKKLENEIKESLVREQLLADIVRESSVGIAIGYPDGRLGLCNSAYQNITGYSEEELKIIDWNKILTPPEWEKSETAKLQEIHKTKKSVQYEKEYIRKDGTRVPIELVVNPRFDKNGTVEYYFAFVIDITDRKIAEKELRNAEVKTRKILMESEKRYRTLFENINAGFVLFEVVQDKKGIPIDLIIVAANKLFEKTTGLINKKVTGKRLSKVLPGIEKDEADWIGTYGKIALTGESKQFEQGSELLGVYYSVMAFQAEPKQCAVTFLDISENKRAEKAFKESEERLRLSTELAHVAAWEFDYRTNKMTRSINHDQLYGIEFQKKWEPETFLKAVHPKDKGSSNKMLHKSIAIGGPDNYTIDFRVVYPDQSIHWLMVTGQVAERNSKGKGILIRGVLMDITERKKLEEEIIQKNRNLESLLETSQELGKNLNLDSVLNEIIKNATKLIGLDTGAIYLINKDELYLGATIPPIPTDFPEVFRHSRLNDHPHIQKSVFSDQPLIVPDLALADLSPAEQAIRESRNMRTLIYLPLKIKNRVLGIMILGTIEKTRLFTEDEINLYRTMSGQAAMAVYNSQLFEEIKKLNEKLEQRVTERTAELSESQMALLNLVEDLNEKSVQLEESTKLLETKNKELETFTYSVSHDLKAPLRGIDGYSRLLEDLHYNKLNDEGKKFIRTIRDGTKQMNQLIEDLLSYSRLERSTFRMASLNSTQFIENLLLNFKDEISKNKITIEKEIQDCVFIADQNGITIAMRNILENAIKFSSEVNRPKIKIVFEENVSSWKLSVKDNGIGFDMKYHNRIFEIFQRLNLPEQFPGTGIGLAMVNKTMERMNGKVWAESSPGNGAAFYLEIQKN